MDYQKVLMPLHLNFCACAPMILTFAQP